MLNIVFCHFRNSLSYLMYMHKFTVVANLAFRSVVFCFCFVLLFFLSGHEGICSIIKKNIHVKSTKILPIRRKHITFC